MGGLRSVHQGDSVSLDEFERIRSGHEHVEAGDVMYHHATEERVHYAVVPDEDSSGPSKFVNDVILHLRSSVEFGDQYGDGTDMS